MATSYSPKIITDGLVFCVDAADKKSYSGSGTTWTDRSGNGYNGTLTNGPTFDSANGGSIDFDGVDDHVTTNFDVDFTQDDFTLDAWVNPNFVLATYGRPIMTMNTTGGCSIHDFALEFGRANGKFGLIAGGGGNGNPSFTSSSTYSQDNWYNINVTRIKNSANNWTYDMYVNGISNQTWTGNASGGSGGKLTIGKFSDCGAVGEWLGKIAAIKIYTKRLSAAEALQNYNATKGRFGL